MGVFATDHRKKTAARGEALKHDIRRMIRMDVNQFVVHEFSHRVRQTARMVNILNSNDMNSAATAQAAGEIDARGWSFGDPSESK